jgi:hypothetical protein
LICRNEMGERESDENASSKLETNDENISKLTKFQNKYQHTRAWHFGNHGLRAEMYLVSSYHTGPAII